MYKNPVNAFDVYPVNPIHGIPEFDNEKKEMKWHKDYINDHNKDSEPIDRQDDIETICGDEVYPSPPVLVRQNCVLLFPEENDWMFCCNQQEALEMELDPTSEK